MYTVDVIQNTKRGVKSTCKSYGGTISTLEFFERFPNEEAAIDSIEVKRWEKGVM